MYINSRGQSIRSRLLNTDRLTACPCYRCSSSRTQCSKYVYGDGFETFYNRTRNLIDTLVEADPTAFYTYEEYQTAADTLYQIVRLRAQSIEGQLDGTIPSTSKEQTSSDALIDASSLSVSAMGTMNTGGRG